MIHFRVLLITVEFQHFVARLLLRLRAARRHLNLVVGRRRTTEVLHRSKRDYLVTHSWSLRFILHQFRVDRGLILLAKTVVLVHEALLLLHIVVRGHLQLLLLQNFSDLLFPRNEHRIES